MVDRSQSRGYHLPETCPCLNTPIAYIQENHHAPLLKQSLETYLRMTLPLSCQPIQVQEFDRLDVFKYITILAPSCQHISNIKRIFKIRVSPKSPAQDTRKKPTPAVFDNAFIIEDLQRFMGTGIEGNSIIEY
ncbi:hypothetical protein JVU11DRAFT_10537 [Chiua virens]|nr:hypothetical protein JVU11DRAFT_10537 [Chiua virens]